MNWKLKCLAFQVLARLPGRRPLYRALQSYVTRTRFATITPPYLRLHQYQAAQYRRVHPGRALEFGGGWDFLSPLLLSHAGATEIRVYDIERLANPPQINNTIRQLRSLVPGEWPEVTDCDGDLERKYRITYCAPGDARATGLPDSSIDFVCSTSTLEHIPRDDVERILRECIRVTRPGAVLSHVIDYTDHYHYADPSISMFNFYRFSEREWRRWNPSNNFQNRLRHSDFEALFSDLALTPIEVKHGEAASDALASVPLAPSFHRYSQSDLLTHSAYFSLQRA